MTTISDIIQSYNARDAQSIFGDIIKANTTDDQWVAILDAARGSEIVNTAHRDSKKIGKFAPSQILRAMNATAMAVWVCKIAINGAEWACDYVVDALNNVSDEVNEWPFSLTSNVMDAIGDTDISAYVDVGDDDDDVDDEFNKLFGDTTSASSSVTFDTDMIDIANMAAAKATNGAVSDLRVLVQERDQLRTDLANAASRAAAVTQPIASDGTIPNGTPRRVNAQAVFKTRSKMLDFDITVYDWDGPNIHVPQVDSTDKFDWDALSNLLFAWEHNLRTWVGGPTGSGKSTLVQQACAYTGTMCRRVNLSKESSTYDLIGKVDVKNGETYFKDGVIPQAMVTPCVLLLDEADAALGDVNMALQPILEGNALVIGEDGGRVVHPHAGFRIVATANTYGSGDSTGLYSAGVKIQGRATMNRYNVFLNVDYMPPSQEMSVVKKHVTMSQPVEDMVLNFLSAYRQCYRNGAIQTPISPRNTITIARMATFYEGILGNSEATTKEAVARAINANVILSADEADADVIKGIADKVVA